MNTTFGAHDSPFDIRTFTAPTKPYTNQKGGTRYQPEDIEYQSNVGICTAISLTQNARKALGQKFSADFQYLIQKKYYDFNWDEGSSIFSSLKAAKGIGLLPEEEWTHTTQADRDLPYSQYIAKLQAIPMAEIARLILIANQHKIQGYASVPVNRDAQALAIDGSRAGILVRFAVGKEWYTDVNGTTTWDATKIEPLRPPKQVISGHAITVSNYDGGSFRVANTWSKEWAEGGTAYYVFTQYSPTECWAVYYTADTLPPVIQTKLQARESFGGKILDLIQKLIAWK